VKAGVQVVATVSEIAPDVLPLAPLLGPVLDVEIAPTAETASIAAEFRRERLADLVIRLLGAGYSARLIVVDDAHWLDGASSSLLERAVAAAGDLPWMVVVARRPVTGGVGSALAGVDIALEPVADATFRDLVDAITVGAPFRPQERDEIVRRAAGNPLFLEELLRVARTTGIDALPETLDAVATREIDGLSQAGRRIVRHASVLGHVFDHDLLVELLGEDAFDESVLTELEGLLVPSAREVGGMEFRHALLQEAAYESLPFRKRIELHRRAGEAILRLPAYDTESTDALLSMHFFRAQEWERTWKHARAAGRHAAAAYAPTEAATHLERAVTAARRMEGLPTEEIAELLSELGDALLTLGVYEKADDAYRRAAANLRHDPIERARVLERRSYVRGECQGRLTAAIRDIRAGVALLGEIPDPDESADRVRAQLLAREADVRYKQGRLREAAKLAGRAMVDAERVGEHRALAVAMSVLDSCLVELGRPAEATHMDRVLALYEQLGDQLYVAVTLGNLGGVSFFASEWTAAASYFVRAAEAANKAGDLATAAIADTNLAEVRVNQGRLREAESLLVPAVRTLVSFEYLIAAALASLHLARTRAFLGDYEAGLAMAESAARTVDEARVLVGSIEARARLAEVSAHAGEPDRAAQALAEARELERELGETPLTILLDRVEVTLAAIAGDERRLQARLPEALARARAEGAKFELLLLLELAARLGTGGDEGERAELARELGVVHVAALPTSLVAPPQS
jgi:tetratricopeptide (TPR) repeat protein